MRARYIDSNLFDCLISILYTVCITIVFFELNNITVMVSMLFSVTFIVLFAMWGLSLARFVTENDIIVLITIVISFLNTLFSAIEYKEGGFEYFKPVILFSCTLIFFSFIDKVRICGKIKKYILFLNLLLSLYVVFFFMTNYDQVFQFNNIRVDYLVLNMDNPNKAALFLSCLFFNLSVLLYKSRKTIFKLFVITIIIAIAYLIYLTGARNALLAIVVFVVTMSFHKRLKNVPKWMLLVLAVFPLLFACVYMLLIKVVIASGYFDFLVSSGKDLDSRILIWKEGFDGFFSHPITGAYYQILKEYSYASLHNTHLHVLVAYGLIPFLLFVKLLHNILKESSVFNGSTLKQVGFFSFAAILFLGCGEASMVLGTQGIYILQGSVLLLTAITNNENLTS